MRLDLNCSYDWINNSSGTIDCSPVFTGDYIVLQFFVGLALLFLVWKGLKVLGEVLEGYGTN